MSKPIGPQSVSSTGWSDEPHGPAGRAELPVPSTQPAPRERADVVRNRAKVLAAAQTLFAARGVDGVTMDDIAAAAGVGKGTLYRGFGDKSGLAMALLSEREKELQARMLTGPTPLGPGAGPVERLDAFVREYLQLVASQLELVLLSQTSTVSARFRSGAHALWRTHCRYLLELAGTPAPQLRAEAILAVLSGEQIDHWLNTDGRPLTELAEDLVGIVRAVAAAK